MQGAQKLRSEAHLPVRRNDEVAAQRRRWTFYETIKIKVNIFDDLVKSLKRRIFVIPAKAGIQLFQILKNSLDSGFHRSDDFLRGRHLWFRNKVWLVCLIFELWPAHDDLRFCQVCLLKWFMGL
jgi:hypothetical protein